MAELKKILLSINGEKTPTTNGVEISLTTASATALAFDEIMKLYYSLKPEYRNGD